MPTALRTSAPVRPIVLLFALLLAGAVPGALAARAEPPAAPDSGQAGAAAPQASPRALLLVEVLDERGRPVSGVDGERISVLRDGRPVAVSVVGTGGPEEVVLFFDLPLLGTHDLLAAASALSERAADLAGLGEVTVVVGDEEASRTVLPATGDPERIAQAVAGVGTRYGGLDALAEVRTRFLEELRAFAGPPIGEGDAPSPSTETAGRVEALTVASLAAEAAVVRAQRERLATWAAEEGELGPDRAAALVLVTGGFDDDPLPFYRRALAAHGLESAVGERLERPVVLPSLQELGRVLASYGWVTVPFVPAAGSLAAEGGADGGEDELAARPEAPGADETLGRPGLDPSDQGEDSRPALVTPRIGRRERAEGAEPPPVRPGGEGFAAIADATGGEVVDGPLQLADLVERLGRRVRLVVDSVPGEPERLEVAPAERSGRVVTVRAPRWAGETPPRSVAAVRARRLLERGAGDRGDLPVEAVFETRPEELGTGRLTVRLGEPDLPPPADGTRLRATVAVERAEGEPLVFHRELEPDPEPGRDAPDEPSAADEAIYEMPVALPEGIESRVAVLVEELPLSGRSGAGRWGSAFATHLEAAAPEAPVDGSLFLPARKAVRLVPPASRVVVGETEITAATTSPRVRRVDFLLDGERVAVRAEAPFSATLDLGALPESRRIEAVAYGEDGSILGRDTLVLNQGGGTFRVRIVEPAADGAGSIDDPVVGPVEVEAEVTAPRGARVGSVEFYWTSRRVATRFEPPFRQRVVIPETAPEGFLRVVARLEDGATAEDVLFLNSTAGGERLDVNLVEMFVVVTDRRGRPVGGLGEEDFRIYEEGEAREVATFRSGGDLPLTVGLAIDSSASMFVKLPAVGEAAGDFVRESLAPDDRAFVVGFGGEPELAQRTTGDRSRLLRAISRLRPAGQTALWESVVHSLVEIQGSPGKKAVIVYSDGADEDEDFSYQTALRFVRQVGVPVYFILTNNEIVRTGGRGLGVRRFLGRVERMAEAAGGRVFVVRHGAELERIYREIGEELRSQYLLAYYSEDLPEEVWRRVRVEAVPTGLEARTITGTYR